MGRLLFILMILLGAFGAHAQDKDLWTWMIAGQQRLVVKCHTRGIVDINSFDSELALVERTTGPNGCQVFDVLQVKDDQSEVWLSNINLNATVYGLDRLKRSPSELVDFGFFGSLIYPIKLAAIRIQTARLGKKLTGFLEKGEFPKTEKVSDNYFRLFVEQAQLAHEDYLTLSR